MSFIKSLSDRFNNVIQKLDASAEKTFGNQPYSKEEEEKAMNQVLEELQMEQVKMTREYQKLVGEKEAEIQRLKKVVGEKGIEMPPSPTGEVRRT